jgi:hypothetical protein
MLLRSADKNRTVELDGETQRMGKRVIGPVKEIAPRNILIKKQTKR